MVKQNAPTDAEVMSYDNVPTDIAARYISNSKPFIYMGLRSGRLPFGTAVQMEGGKWSYNISPGLLVAYKKGTLKVQISKAVETKESR